MTTVIVVYNARSGLGDALYQALSGTEDIAVSTPGCAAARLLRDVHDPDRVVAVEEWEHTLAHEAWLEQQAVDGAFGPLESLLARAPEIHYLVPQKR